MKLSLSIETERKLRQAISEGDLASFSRLASPLKWGKPSYSASRLLVQELGDDEGRLWLWAGNLANQRDPYVRRYASDVLLRLWGKNDQV